MAEDRLNWEENGYKNNIFVLCWLSSKSHFISFFLHVNQFYSLLIYFSHLCLLSIFILFTRVYDVANDTLDKLSRAHCLNVWAWETESLPIKYRLAIHSFEISAFVGARVTNYLCLNLIKCSFSSIHLVCAMSPVVFSSKSIASQQTNDRLISNQVVSLAICELNAHMLQWKSYTLTFFFFFYTYCKLCTFYTEHNAFDSTAALDFIPNSHFHLLSICRKKNT